MAKTIDERVVSMKFDNQNFERNVAESMSTLDKLKEKLSFKGASKGVDELNNAMGKFDFNPMANAVDYVGKKFSALEEIAKGALRKIGNDITGWAEGTVKSMSGLENMAAGFSKYSQKTTAVTTLVAQGFDLDTVNEQMEKLNWFTDETSYNFVSMVNEIGKFTASGQGLEESVRAMMGIANWAALSGQNATKASQAMYQLSQAMSKGALRYDDWKSIQNASMDTKEFREMAVNTAIALGSMKKVGEDAYRAVYETDSGVAELSEDVYTLNELFSSDGLTKLKWLDTDVMMSVFDQYGKATKSLKALVDEGWQDVDTASSAMDELEKKAKVIAQQMLESGEAVDEDDALNKALLRTSLDAVRGLESVKEEVRAYAEETGKDISTTEGFNAALVELGYGIDAFSLKALKAAQQARTWEDVIDSVKDAVSTGWMNTFEKVIGNQEEAVTLMTRLANDFWDIFAAGGENRNSVFDVWRNWMEPQMRNIKSVPESVRKILVENGTFTEAINGRDLLFSTEEGNLGAIISLLQTIKDLLAVVGDAWNEIMYGTTNEDEIAQQKADTLMAITKAIKSFADAVAINEEKADKLKRTFKGLFAIIDIVKTFIGSALNAVFKGLSLVLGNTNADILEITASIGDNINKFKDWIKQSKIFDSLFKGIGYTIGAVALGIKYAFDFIVNGIRSFIDYISSLPVVKEFIENIGDAISKVSQLISDFFKKVEGGEDIGKAFQELLDGISAIGGVKTILSDVWDAIKTFWKNIFNVTPKESKVNNAIGGVIDSIKNTFNSLIEYFGLTDVKLDDAMDQIKNTLSSITISDIAMIAVGVAAIVFITKMFKALSKVGKIVDILGDLSNAITGLANSIKKNLRANTMLFVSASIVALVGALAVIAYLDPDRVWNAFAVLSAIVALFTVLVYVVNSMKGLGAASIAVAGLAASMALLMLSLSAIASFSGNQLQTSAIVLAALTTWLLLVGALATRLVSKSANLINMGGLAIMFIGVASALVIMVYAIKKLTELNLDNIDKVSELFMKMMLGLALVTAASKLMGKGSGTSILAAAGALYIILIAINKIAEMDYAQTMVGLMMIKTIFNMFAETLAVIGLSSLGRGYKGVTGSIIGLTLGLTLILGLVRLVSMTPQSEMVAGLNTVKSIMEILIVFVAVSYFAGEHASKAGTMLIKMAAALTILTFVIAAMTSLAHFNKEAFESAVNAMAILTVIMMGSIGLSKFAKESKGALTALMGMVVTLAIVLAILSSIDPTGQSSMMAAISIGIVLATLAGVIASTKLTKGASKALIPLVIAIGVISGLLVALSILPIQNSIQNAAALSIVMLTLAASLVVITRFGDDISASVMAGVVVLGLFMAVMGGVLVELNKYDTGNAIINAAAIGILMLTLMSSLVVVSLFGPMAEMGWTTIGLLAVLVAAIAALAFMLSSMSDTQNAIQNASAIALLMGSLSVVMLLMIPVGLLAAPAIAGALILLGFIGVLFALITGLGALMSDPTIAEWINTGLPMMEQLGKGLGSFFGGIIEGASVAMSNALPEIGKNIETFSISLANFAGNVKDIKVEDFASIEKIASVIALLSAAEFVNSISQFTNIFAQKIGGEGTTVSSFSDSLKSFGEAVKSFYGSVKDIEDTDKLQKAADAAYSLINVANALPKHGGVVQWFTGDNDLAQFATDMLAFAPKVVEISKIFASQPVNYEAVQSAVNAALLLTGLADNLPKHGGVVQWFMGDNTLTEFGVELLNFAPKIVRVSEILSQGKFDTGSVEAAVNCAKLVAGLADNLPKHNGVVQWFMGDNNLTEFGVELLNFAPKIVRFAEIISEGGAINQTAVEAAVNAAGLVAGLEEKLPKKNGFLNFFTGTSDLSEFAEDLPLLGTGIKQFSDNIAGIDSGAMTVALTALEVLSTLESNLPETGNIFTWLSGEGKDLDGFITDMPKLAEGIKTFSNTLTSNGGINSTAVTAAAETLSAMASLSTIGSLSGVSNLTNELIPISENLKKYSDTLQNSTGFSDGSLTDVTNAIHTLGELESELIYTDYKKISKAFSELNSLVGLLNRVTALDSKKIEAFGTVMKDFGKNGLTDFLNSFSDSESQMSDAATIILNSFSRGIKDNSGLFTDAFNQIIDNGISTIRGRYQDMVDVGGESAQAVIDGMKSGLEDETNGVQNQVSSVMSGINLDIKQFIPGLDSTSSGGTTSIPFVDDLKNAITSQSGLGGISTDVGNFGIDWGNGLNDAFKQATSNGSGGLTMVDDFEKLLTGETGLGGIDLNASGEKIFNSFIGGFNGTNSTSQITTAVNSLGASFDTAVTEDIETYKTAGRNAVDGFVEGLKQKSWQVNQIGKDMADKLLTGIETGLDSHSPSRETYQRGIYAGQGFINALTDYVTRSFDAGENIAQSATDGMREAIEQSAYAFDASMEIQPTITPVVDLSNVQQSASAIDDIFSTDTSIGLVGNVTRTMDENQQNIQNEISLDDTNIVNELRDLRTDMAIMADRFSKLQVILDTNVLVGQLTDPMDTALGSRVNRRKRG